MGGFIKTLMLALILAMLFRSFLYEPFHIPSGSMEDTLLIGDYIFISKFSYGYSRYSFPFSLPLFKGRVMRSAPERGDIVVFRPPTHPRTNYIKRLIGLPGDTIQMKGGVLHINGSAIPKNAAGNFAVKQGDTVTDILRFEETLPEGKTYQVLDMGETTMDDTGVYTVPDGHYFMMGDNRDNSQDSRYSDAIGFIPEENLVGRAEMIFVSFGEGLKVWNPLSWGHLFRSGRFCKDLST